MEENKSNFVRQDIVTRGGRCLIPVFALGRAQELLLILDEFWAAHPELHEIPIYYASSLAKKCMAVYQVRHFLGRVRVISISSVPYPSLELYLLNEVRILAKLFVHHMLMTQSFLQCCSHQHCMGSTNYQALHCRP